MSQVSKGYSLTHIHKFYQKKNKSIINKVLFTKICGDFNKRLVEEALAGNHIRMPYRLGVLWIKKYKMNWNKPLIDFRESKIQGKIVYHDNIHSEGWGAKWAWKKINHDFENAIYYSLTATRKNARELAKVMKTPGQYKKFFTQI